MPNEENVVKVDTYNAVELSEYGGFYSLVACTVGQNDVYYFQWCLPSFYDKDTRKRRFKTEDEKAEPMKIKLGKKEDAIQVLETLLIKLKGGVRQEIPDAGPDDSEIPF